MTAETMLVCLDFDGTLAEMNPDPYAVAMHPMAEEALRRLAALPETEVAILTGRHLEGLRRVLPEGLDATLVGSHGAEPGPALSAEDEAYLAQIETALRAIAVPPAYVEVKPFQCVLHVAPVADAEAARQMLDAALAIDTDRPVTQGRNVVEFSAAEVTKGSWLAAYKQDFDVTVFAGDDDTDETALAVLGPGDVGIKVGPKPTCASTRMPDVNAMAQFLLNLAKEREAWNATN